MHNKNQKFLIKETAKIISEYLYNVPSLPIKQIQSEQSSPEQSNRPYRRHEHDLNKIFILTPLDRFMRQYFSRHKYLGKEQRSYISDKTYSLIRYEYLLAHLTKTAPYSLDKYLNNQNKPIPPPTGKALQQIHSNIQYKISLLNTTDFYQAMDNPQLPKYLRCSQNKMQLIFHKIDFFKSQALVIQQKKISLKITGPKILFMMAETYVFQFRFTLVELGNQEKAYSISKVMNQRAPLTLRVNPLKTQKHILIEKLQKQFNLRLKKCQHVPYGFKIVSSKSFNLLETQQFQHGDFQIQDQGSQLVASRIRCRPGDLVLDYCGGSGGKSLAIAHLLEGKGQIFIHQPREVALQKAKKRFQRAGVTNVQFHNDEQNLKKIIIGKVNWVIVDAPCTGTGTIRRNPDIKLKFNTEWVKKNVIQQQEIFASAMKFLGKGYNARIVYITCSLLKEENEEQVEYFIKMHNLEVENDEILKVEPQRDGADGFFAVVLKRRGGGK